MKDEGRKSIIISLSIFRQRKSHKRDVAVEKGYCPFLAIMSRDGHRMVGVGISEIPESSQKTNTGQDIERAKVFERNRHLLILDNVVS